jgi:hypothetical protein
MIYISFFDIGDAVFGKKTALTPDKAETMTFSTPAATTATPANASTNP